MHVCICYIFTYINLYISLIDEDIFKFTENVQCWEKKFVIIAFSKKKNMASIANCSKNINRF